MAASRASDGRFRPRYENVVLWRVIVEVAVLARPDYPQAVTTKEWDEARALSFWPDAPSAAALCKRFATAWRALIALAFDDGRDWGRSVGMRPQVALVSDLSAEEIRQSIRCVWQAIGFPPSLSAPRYEKGLGKLADPQGFSTGVAPSQLANANQIIYAAGSWARALAIADLDVPARGSYRRVLSVVEALDGYVDETGRLAPVRWVIDERRAKRQERIATPSTSSAEYVAQLRAYRAGRGLATPELDARGTAHAELEPGMPASDWAPDLGWTWDACVFALARLLLRLPPGTRSMTQARHRQLVPGTEAPWPATLQRAVNQENAERRAKGLAADLTVGDQDDLAFVRLEACSHCGPLVLIGRVDREGPDPDPLGRSDLVAHQREQWADQEHRARPLFAEQFRGDEVDEALAPAGALHHQCPRSALQHRFDRLPLTFPECRIRAEHSMEESVGALAIRAH
jgi:hypothetical protein